MFYAFEEHYLKRKVLFFLINSLSVTEEGRMILKNSNFVALNLCWGFNSDDTDGLIRPHYYSIMG